VFTNRSNPKDRVNPYRSSDTSYRDSVRSWHDLNSRVVGVTVPGDVWRVEDAALVFFGEGGASRKADSIRSPHLPPFSSHFVTVCSRMTGSLARYTTCSMVQFSLLRASATMALKSVYERMDCNSTTPLANHPIPDHAVIQHPSFTLWWMPTPSLF
jgi:hypothetical protein